MTILASTGFEAGTLAANVPTNGTDMFNAGSVSGTGSAVYDDQHTHGASARSMLMAGADTTGQALRTYTFTAAAVGAVRGYFYFPTAPPTVNAGILSAFAAGVKVGDIRLTTARNIQMRDVASTTKTSSGLITLGVLYRFEWKLAPNPSTGRQYFRYASGGNLDAAGTVDELLDNGTCTGTAATTIDEIRVTLLSGQTGGWSFWVDDYAVGNTDWVGPTVAGGNLVTPPPAISTAAMAVGDTGTGITVRPTPARSVADSGDHIVVVTAHPGVQAASAASFSTMGIPTILTGAVVADPFAAAVTAQERQPLHQVLVDWSGDGFYGTRLRTNLCPNPSFETNTTGWAGSNATIAKTSTYSKVDGNSCLLTATATSFVLAQTPSGTSGIPVTPSLPYALSSQVRAINHATGCRVRVDWYTAAGAFISSSLGQQATIPIGSYAPLTLLATAPATAAFAQLYLSVPGPVAVNDVFSWDAVLFEQCAIIDTYFDGAQPGASWTGTPHASTSTLLVANTSIQALDDLSGDVTSIIIDRRYTTDIPDVARLVTGYAVAEAQLELARGRLDPTDTATTHYSPYNPASPLYGKQRMRRPCQVQLGLQTTTGPQLLPAFTGLTRLLQVAAGARTAHLEALDGAESMRGTATVPLIAADDFGTLRYGLSGSYVIDLAARACGHYQTPPTRPGCMLSVPFTGSAYPEIGRAVDVEGANGPLPFVVDARTDAAHRVFTDPTADTVLTYALTAPLADIIGNGVLVEMFEVGVDGTKNAPIPGQPIQAPTDIPLWSLTTGNGYILSCYVTPAGQIKVNYGLVSSPGTQVSCTGPSISVFGKLTALQYLAVNVTFGVTTAAVDFRLNSVTTSSSFTWTTAADTAFTQLHVGRDDSRGLYGAISVRGLQLTPETNLTRAAFNDSFTPTADLDPSISTLIAVPQVSGSWWDMCAQIAAAEFGTLQFTEAGVLQFRSRARWNRADALVPVRTVTSLTNIKDLATTETIDSVRNKITVPAAPVQLGPPGIVWQSAEAYKVPAGATIVVTATLDTAATSLDPNWRYRSLTGPIGGQSEYRANTKINGLGGQYDLLTFTTTVIDATTVQLTIHNNHTADLFIVNPDQTTAGAGTPALYLWGRRVLAGSSVTAIAQDTGSILALGEQTLDLPANDWRQSLEAARTLAADLLSDLRIPTPQIPTIDVVGDPRNSLGDRITVVDTTGTAIDHDWWIVGINTQLSPGLPQTLTLRPAQKIRPGWTLGVVDHLGVDTILL